MTKEAGRTAVDPQREAEAKIQKGKAKEKEKTQQKAKDRTQANLQPGVNPQVDKKIANLVLTLSRENVKRVTNVIIGTNQHVKLSKMGRASTATTASFPTQRQRLE